MALAKLLIKDFSVEVLEYPEIAIPEQGLKVKIKCIMPLIKKI